MSDRLFDFTTLGGGGQDLEQLTRDLCEALGYRAAWSGKGADDGKDLIVMEPTSPDFGGIARKWLVSCKDFADSGRSVSAEAIGDAPSRLEQHACQGLLLVTTTQPSTGLIRAFEGWSGNTRFLFHYWDAPMLKELLGRDASTAVASAYFPAPGEVSVEVVSEPTESEMVRYLELSDGRSFYFQIRKEPDDGTAFVGDYELAIEHLRSRLSPTIDFAIRGVFFDDKHSSFHWRVDIASTMGFHVETDTMRDKLSEVLVEAGEYMGQWHDFEFRIVEPDQLDPVTPRVTNEGDLNLFSSWPDET